MGRRLIVLFLLILLASALAEVFLPRTVERGLEVGLANMLGGDPEVELRSFPALKLLLGRFDRITVDSQNVPAGRLLVDHLTSTLEDVAINMPALLLDRTLVVERVSRQTVTLRLSEESLRRYLAEAVPGLDEHQVTLQGGVASLRGRLDLRPRAVRLGVEGGFRIDADDPSRVLYDIQRLSFDGVPVEGSFLPKLVEMLGGPEVFIDLDRSPMPLRATAVRVDAGWLIIEGQVVE
ncbi:MAG: DUF2993 domain-containing protein [bacterium]|nr:DUF2993 domain-containing protein [bacterium]